MSDRLFTAFPAATQAVSPLAAWRRAMFRVLPIALLRRTPAEPVLRSVAYAAPAQAVPGKANTTWGATPHRTPRRRPAASQTLFVSLQQAWRRHRSRQRIAMLDAHALKDIGVTYSEAEAEANKPFWVR